MAWSGSVGGPLDRSLAAYRGAVAKTRSIGQPPVEVPFAFAYVGIWNMSRRVAAGSPQKAVRRPAAGALQPWAGLALPRASHCRKPTRQRLHFVVAM
jgi:hypothetical protein